MPKHLCPLCSAPTVQTAERVAVCSYCETSVRTLKHVTIIQPRPMAHA
jgi:hypothetical protein